MLTKKMWCVKSQSMKFAGIFLLSHLALMSSSVSFATPIHTAGGEVGGGSDQVVYSEILFATKNPEVDTVKICYEKDPSFQVPDAEIIDAISWAYSTWANYMRLKDLANARGDYGMALNAEVAHSGCTDDDDLHLFLGVTPDSVLPSLAALNTPLAEAASFPNPTGQYQYWKKGFIWFAKDGSIDLSKNLPMWQLPSSVPNVPASDRPFREILLHEMGHVFGNSHVNSTIMSSTLYDWVMEEMDISQPFFIDSHVPITIDQGQELVDNVGVAETFNLDRAYGYTVMPSGTKSYPNFQALANTYLSLTGMTATAGLTAIAVRPQSPSFKSGLEPDEEVSADLQIQFSDQGQITSLPIHILGKISQNEDSTPLFNGQHGDHFHSSSYSYLGSLTAVNGTVISVVVNYNSGGTFQVIRLDQPDLEYPLFQSSYGYGL